MYVYPISLEPLMFLNADLKKKRVWLIVPCWLKAICIEASPYPFPNGVMHTPNIPPRPIGHVEWREMTH